MEERELLRQLMRFYAGLDRFYRLTIRQTGLPESQFWILYYMDLSEGPVSLAGMVKYSGMPKQTVHSALKKMLAAGTVRPVNEKQSREGYELTELGREEVQKHVHHVQEEELLLLNRMSGGQPERLTESMTRALGELDQDEWMTE